MKPLIKICGINDFNVLQKLVSMDNINYLGFIFYEKSVRNVSPEFLERVKEFEFKDKRPVCVYVNSDQDFIKQTSSYFKDPILQFHGDETSDFCNSFDNEFWKVLRINNQINVDEIIRYEKASGILFENYKKDQPGGTGESFDWSLINSVKDFQKDMGIRIDGVIGPTTHKMMQNYAKNNQNSTQICKISKT